MYWNKRIKDLREDNDLTKQELADELDISERTLTRYETGESEPTISVLIKMSLIFNVSLDYICCIKDEVAIVEEGTIDKLKKLSKDLESKVDKINKL